MESGASEGWRLVVGGEPGLALAFFFGDELGSLVAFLGDAVLSVLLARLFALGHHHVAIRAGLLEQGHR